MDKQKFYNHKKLFGFVSVLVLVIFVGLVSYFIGRPMLALASEPETFRNWISSKGVLGRIIFILMVAVQVIFAIIPGEPLEIGAGYAFGAIEGTILCLLGFLLGSFVIFLFVKKWGIRFVELFFSLDKINSLRFLNTNKKLNAVAFLLFLIPGTPKDLLVYFLCLTNIKLPAFIVTVTLMRIPSVLTSTLGGNALGVQNYKTAIIVFAVTILISLSGYLLYTAISKHHSKKS